MPGTSWSVLSIQPLEKESDVVDGLPDMHQAALCVLNALKWGNAAGYQLVCFFCWWGSIGFFDGSKCGWEKKKKSHPHHKRGSELGSGLGWGVDT